MVVFVAAAVVVVTAAPEDANGSYDDVVGFGAGVVVP